MSRSWLIVVDNENLVCKVAPSFPNSKLLYFRENIPCLSLNPLVKSVYSNGKIKLCCLTFTKRALTLVCTGREVQGVDPFFLRGW